MEYAWIYNPDNPLEGIPVTLAIYIDKEASAVLPFLQAAFTDPTTGMQLVPIIQCPGKGTVEAKVREKAGYASSINMKVRDRECTATLLYEATRNPSEAYSYAGVTPAGFTITITANPGKMAYVLGYMSGYRLVYGFGVVSTFTLTITPPP